MVNSTMNLMNVSQHKCKEKKKKKKLALKKPKNYFGFKTLIFLFLWLWVKTTNSLYIYKKVPSTVKRLPCMLILITHNLVLLCFCCSFLKTHWKNKREITASQFA